MLSFGKRVSYAFRCFFSVFSSGEIPEEIAPEVVRSLPEQEAPEASPQLPAVTASPVEKVETETHDRAVQMLALLQRDGRLIDFFNEDIAGYTDAQVGAAVREIHSNCRKVLDNYVRLEPVLEGEEGRPVTVEAGFDPSVIKLTGSVTGKPPLRGLLQHHGWRATKVELPPLAPDAAGRGIVAPAEVEVQ